MKYLFQMMVIGGITFTGELLNSLLPLPVPASVYGMLLLFAGLCTGIIKLEQIEETADFLLVIMPVLFISPSVSMLESLLDLEDQLVPILIISGVSTIAVMLVTGAVSQAVIRRKRKKENREV